MNNSFLIDGYWWLPTNPNNRIAGTFNFKTDELSDLKLYGDFDKQDFLSLNANPAVKSPLIIFGEDDKANQITLVVLAYGQIIWNFSSSFPLIHYKIQYCFQGIHLTNIYDKKFQGIEIEIQSLSDWINEYPVKLSLPIKDEKLTADFILTYSKGKECVSFDINEGCVLSMHSRASFSDIRKDEIIIQQRNIIRIINKDLVDFHTLIKKSYRFQSFLNMAMFSQNNFITLNLFCAEKINDLTPKCIPNKIKLFFKQLEKGTTNNQSFRNDDYLFSYDEVKDAFPELIKKWFAFDKKMMPIMQHLIDSIEPKAIFKSTDFLIIVQALEGYHHRFFDPEPEKEKNLENRLRNIKNFFSRDITLIRDINTNLTANSRNYYSHFYNKPDEIQIAEGTELYNLTNKLRYLLICCLLYELGLDNLKIAQMLQKYD